MKRFLNCAQLACALLILHAHTAQGAAPAKPVKLLTLSDHAMTVERQFYGQVVARETVNFAFQVAGQIVRMPIAEGAVLEAGSLIAELDLEPFVLARDRARVQFQQATSNYKRFSAAGLSNVSQADIDEAQSTLALANVALKQAEYSLKRASLHSPFKALVAKRLTPNFSTVSAGTAVARLHDMSEIHIEIEMPELLFHRAQQRGPVALFATLVDDAERYPLEIYEYATQTSPVGQTYTLTLKMLATPSQLLLPGASVTVLARQQTEKTQIILPPTALVVAPDGTTSVMVFEATDSTDTGLVRKHIVDIEVGAQGQFIMLKGPEAGREIVLTGASSLLDGQAVRRFRTADY
ncbi:RND family efflux transporter MFP subunit [Oceanococcus atlanticus]|uniref:RND family efflux transporter MFP subunit n=1 Tax=Oceanococcus atlanticus TaxID=1317117 RepID=A0A1Y1SCR9_9GAMM|nr:efflux RND transporter periplasmic adaptor subunit [Oceanococcus atlanticus]ORE86422.1 RND family efflux transporter MFP subunit [Oceanococcus atlanticus]